MLPGIPLLSLVIWVPIVFGLLVLATGSDRNAPMARSGERRAWYAGEWRNR